MLVGCKLVTTSNENRMNVHFQVKIELLYDLVGPPLGLSPEKTRIKKIQADNLTLQ